MIFFTRALYDAQQPGSGTRREADRTWTRRVKQYRRYSEVVLPLLPASVRQLCREGLHDATVRSAKQAGNRLSLVLDTSGAVTKFADGTVKLTFKGVHGRPRIGTVKGRWWLYEEAHLSANARFSVHMLFDKGELVVDADDLVLTYKRSRARKAGLRALLKSLGVGAG
jgi:hypothetical protein